MTKKKNIKWSKEYVSKLVELYPNMRNKDISKELNISSESIKNKAHKLGLCKKLSKMKLLDMATEHMKDKRRYYTKELAKQIIKNYTNVGDLRRKEHSIYAYIIRHKLNNLISHLERNGRC